MAKINKTDLYVLKEELGIKQFNAFPGDISLKYDKTQNKLVMTLTKEAAGFRKKDKKDKKYINMQENSACFEGWCLIIQAQTQTKTTISDLKIELDVKDINDSSYPSYPSGRPANGHLGRFLYRILKFSEQYEGWFKLSEKLKALKDKFKQYLKENSFEASPPSKEAEIAKLESYIEYLFYDSISAQKDILGLPSGTTIDRQLPVGLFEKPKGNANEVFTAKKSAVDFWALDDDTNTINVYELKSKNPMVGIITEIFFYSNYVYDVFIKGVLDDPNGVVKPATDVTLRSYDKIKGEKVKGIMLSNRRVDKKNNDGWHASLTEKESRKQIIKIMNANGMSGAIQYEFLEYQLNPLKIGGYYISK